MFIAKIENNTAVEYPISERELRRRLGNTSLPKTLTNEIIEPLGYVIVPPGTIDNFPTATKDLKVVLESITKIDGNWVRQYTLEPVPNNDKQWRLEKKWKEVRAKRDKLMADFDWRILRHTREVALSLTPTEDITALHNYMQALADITDQEDPFLIQYPTFGEN